MIREELTLQEKFDLRKKLRMTDLLRGRFYRDSSKTGEVCRYYRLNKRVQLINCHNFNKYTLMDETDTSICVVLLDDEPIGLVYISNFGHICKLWACKKYKDWDENRICKILKENTDVTYEFWQLDDNQESLEDIYQQKFFKEHLKFEDDLLAYLWRNMGVSMTKQQLQEYANTIFNHRDHYTDKQKKSIAKEIVFYIIPQYLSNVWEEAEQQIAELCRFVMEEYDIVWRDHVSIKQTQLRLKQLFLIDTVEKAKEYYIANECSVERYKNCCMDVDYEEIMDSFEQWSHVIQEEQWRKEALERCFHAQDVYKDWNVERMIELISHLHVDVTMLKRLKSYISDNLQDIHVWDVLSFHIQMLIPDYKDNSELQGLWEECCKALHGFEYKKLDMEEKERFRKILNSSCFLYEEYQYVNCAKNIIVLRGSTRLIPPRDPEDPRWEWWPDRYDPIRMTFIGEEGLLGRMEVSDFNVIWHVIEGDRQKLVDLYTEYARNLEIISPERKIRNATKEEAEGWEEKAERYCIGNANFLGSTEWWLGAKKEITPSLMREVIREIKSEDKCYVRRMLSLVFYVLPNIERKSELWTRDDMVCINEYLSRTLKDFTGEEIVPSDYTPEALIAAYRPYCLGNRLEVAKKIYKYFNCKKRRCLGNSGSYLYYDELWDSYNQFDISEYEREWMQEEFALEKESVYKFASRFLQSACGVLDLLEKIGTYENYKWFMEEIEKFEDHEYILYRLNRMHPNIADEDVRKLVQDFCEQLRTEVKEKKGEQCDE